MIDFGECVCGEKLEAAYFEEKEYDALMVPTGRVRTNVNYLFCPNCGRTECTDGSYGAGLWHHKEKA